MKQFVVTLLAVLVGGFLALLAYDRFIVTPRQTARPPEATDAAPAVASTGAPAAPTPQVAPGPSTTDLPPLADIAISDSERAALVIDAARRATMYRVALTEYYQTNGRWPLDADEAGLPSPAEARGGAVQAVEVDRSGVVTVRLDRRFGRDGAFVLRPTANDATGTIDWHCEVRGAPDLKKTLPRCS
ncbi:MAG: pilin [Lysobacteraceae bacterium]